MNAGNAKPNARDLALRVLTHNSLGRRFVTDVLDELLAGSGLSAADRRLASELVLGTVRHQMTLDAIIAAFLRRPDQAIDVEIREVLRTALYQMLFLDRIPVHAAVKSAVDLARSRGERPAAGFVNAVLRSVDRSMKIASEPPAHPPEGIRIRDGRWVHFDRAVLPKTHPLPEHLAAAYSHPEWMVRRWVARFGHEKTEALLQTNNLRPRVTIRPMQIHTDADALRAELEAAGFDVRTNSTGDAFQLASAAGLADLAALAKGRCHVMDLTAMIAVETLSPTPDSRVLDLCAAPGGKTLMLADRMADRGVLVACDISTDKMDRLADNVRRARLHCVHVRHAEAVAKIAAEDGMFDFALVDAPCSNTGVLARRVDARYRLGECDLVSLAKLQFDVLTTAASVLAPGGALVYSTCSLEPEENSQMIHRFLRARKDFTLDADRQTFPSPAPLWHDGGYIARLVRSA